MADNSNQDEQKPTGEISYDFSDFEKRLVESRLAFNDENSKITANKAAAKAVELDFKLAIDTAPQAVKKIEPMIIAEESGFLAGLALEATESLNAKQISDRDKQERALSVNSALDRALKFLIPFIRHVNTVEPAIARTYHLDARTIFTNLKWESAIVDSRRQGMADDAHLTYVTFSVNLRAPEPVLLKRPWEQFDALKKELLNLRLTTLEDLEEMRKNPKQEWLEAQLDSALPIQLTFKGGYEIGKVDVFTRNLADFGQLSFQLSPEDISVALLEELGLFLLARKPAPPVLLRAPLI